MRSKIDRKPLGLRAKAPHPAQVLQRRAPMAAAIPARAPHPATIDGRHAANETRTRTSVAQRAAPDSKDPDEKESELQRSFREALARREAREAEDDDEPTYTAENVLELSLSGLNLSEPALTEAVDALVDAARRNLRGRVFVKRPLVGAPALQDLLTRNLCIAEDHFHRAPKRFLIQNMPILRALGYRYLFMEHLRFDVDQRPLYNYLQPAGQMSAALTKHLAAQDQGMAVQRGADVSNQRVMSDPTSAAAAVDERSVLLEHKSVAVATVPAVRDADCNYTGVIRAAKLAGIVVVCLDTRLAHDSPELREGEERIWAMNYTAREIITRMMAASEHRWLALMGTGHVNRYLGVPGVSELLPGCTDLFVFDRRVAREQKEPATSSTFRFDHRSTSRAGADNIELRASASLEAGPSASLSLYHLQAKLLIEHVGWNALGNFGPPDGLIPLRAACARGAFNELATIANARRRASSWFRHALTTRLYDCLASGREGAAELRTLMALCVDLNRETRVRAVMAEAALWQRRGRFR